MGEQEIQLKGIVDDLAGPGWSICDGFLDEASWLDLSGEAKSLDDAGLFRRAGVGAGVDHQLHSEIRSDRIFWLQPGRLTESQSRCLACFDAVRDRLNRELYLGLWEFEAHLAVYPQGSFYRKHLDQFRAVESRQVTAILYLNPAWTPADGGVLRLYLDEDGAFIDIPPVGGRLVTFLSARFYHEVLPATRERLSLTGWFKRRL